jgi:nucleoside-triphosphatase THEP1
MEILSSYFRQAVLEALDSDSSMLGTIVRRSTPFTDSIKARPEVTTIEVTPNNRDALLDHLLTQFREISLTSGE